MKTYICSNCGYEVELIDGDVLVCPNCGKKEEVYKKSDNEIDAIIDSVLEDVLQENSNNIVNENEKDKSICIDDDNLIVGKVKDKCVNCGQCKKTCENVANIKYNMNECTKPICISCGSCVLNCPSNALYFKQNYEEVKRIIDLNEKIVVAIVDPGVYSYLSTFIKKEDPEKVFVGSLKQVGFDYVFNGAFAGDLCILEEVTEFAERLKNKELLPMITSSCNSWVKYAEIYHPELLNNISTCKNKLQMHSALVKEFFAKEKGFDSSKIVTVSISNCTSIIDVEEEKNNLDYNITMSELSLLYKDCEIDFNSVQERDYDELLSEASGSAYLTGITGGESEAFVRTFYRIMKRAKLKNDEIDFVVLRNVNGIRDASIQIGDYRLRIAVVEGLKNFEKLLTSDKYKRYHFIEVMNCIGGCSMGSGRLVNIDEEVDATKLYEKDYSCQSRCSHDNKDIKKVYTSFLGKPLSEKALETLHCAHNDNSNKLKNK